MGLGRGREAEGVATGLAAWWRAKHPDHRDVRVAPPTRPSAGLSSETFLVDVSWRGGGSSLVLRLPPPGDGLFPAYDLAAQALVQEQLGQTVVPVAAPLAVEEDASWLGATFLLMTRVPGRLLADFPPFLTEGWLHESSRAEQRAVHVGFAGVLADIHRLDWRGLGLGSLARGEPPYLACELAWWSDYLRWAGESPPVVRRALEWCIARCPDGEPAPSLLWGDVRLGNVIFDESPRPVAVLDWEMASIGPAELDVGWFLALHEQSVRTAGEDLPGFLSRDEYVAAYEQRLGRELSHLDWYEVFALVRSAAIMVRVAAVLAQDGVDDSWLRGNPMLAELDRRISRGT